MGLSEEAKNKLNDLWQGRGILINQMNGFIDAKKGQNLNCEYMAWREGRIAYLTGKIEILAWIVNTQQKRDFKEGKEE